MNPPIKSSPAYVRGRRARTATHPRPSRPGASTESVNFLYIHRGMYLYVLGVDVHTYVSPPTKKKPARLQTCSLAFATLECNEYSYHIALNIVGTTYACRKQHGAATGLEGATRARRGVRLWGGLYVPARLSNIMCVRSRARNLQGRLSIFTHFLKRVTN